MRNLNERAWTKKDILNAIIRQYADGNKSRFASMLGITPQAISTWEKRNTFDIELIFTKCENINATWLLTGKGEMLTTDTPSVSVHPQKTSGDPLVDRLLGIIESKDELIRQQAEEIGHLRAQIGQLTQRLQKNADTASTSVTAHVG